MNYYIVVEGSVEKKVYAEWIPLMNPTLKQIHSLGEVTQDNFIIFDGGGFPYIREMIDNAIADLKDSENSYKLIIFIDSEEMTREDKFHEIDTYIISSAVGLSIDYKIIVQHFCFETWALGNRKIVSSNPNNPELVAYLRHFHVRKNDPELLTSISINHGNRAQFAESYLRKLLQQKFHQTYSKRNPAAVTHAHYFSELKKRLQETGHIDSFNELLVTFTM
ncbi:MAG: hypothetical protein ACU841_10920 [Gammaproteobacteria bacterium]